MRSVTDGGVGTTGHSDTVGHRPALAGFGDLLRYTDVTCTFMSTATPDVNQGLGSSEDTGKPVGTNCLSLEMPFRAPHSVGTVCPMSSQGYN